MQECENLGRAPKPFLRDVICQFYLSNVYNDLLDTNKILSAFYKLETALEKHHVVPLGSQKFIKESTATLRDNKNHILNSPLNFVYITKETNLAISDMKIEEYYSFLNGSCVNVLSFNLPLDTSTPEKIKEVLSNRFDQLKSKLSSRFIELLGN